MHYNICKYMCKSKFCKFSYRDLYLLVVIQAVVITIKTVPI